MKIIKLFKTQIYCIFIEMVSQQKFGFALLFLLGGFLFYLNH